MQRQDAAAAAAHEAARRAAGLSPQPPHQRAQLHVGAGAPGAASAEVEAGQAYGNAAFLAAQQQQAAALALVSDIRAAAAAAQIRQAAQLQQAQMLTGHPSNADNILLARAAQQQLGLGALAGVGGVASPHLLELQQQQELELHLIQQQELELQRRQRAAQAAARQQEEQAQLAQQQQQQQRMSRQIQQPQQRRQQSPPQLEEPSNSERRPRSPSESGSVPERQVTPSVSTANEKEAPENEPYKTVDAPKDRFKKTPGSMVVPCRARGMPMDHNFKTAYFVIPENVEHGDELICSYFSCRNAGIKFRYCTHCKVPVAKRNFRKRHKHGMSFIPGDDDGNGKSDESDDGESTNSHHTELTMQNRQKPPAQPSSTPGEIKIPKSKHDIAERPSVPNMVCGAVSEEKRKGPPFDQMSSMRPTIPTSIPPKLPQAQPHRAPGVAEQAPEENGSASLSRERVPEAPMSLAVPPKRNNNPTGHPKIDEKRATRWESLLGERPPTGDSNAMSSWLLEVLAVSDLDKPLADDAAAPAPPPPPPIIGNAREQKEPSQLPKVRPVGAEPADGSMPSFASLKKYKKRDHTAMGRMGGPGAANAHSGSMGPRKKGKGSNGK